MRARRAVVAGGLVTAALAGAGCTASAAHGTSTPHSPTSHAVSAPSMAPTTPDATASPGLSARPPAGWHPIDARLAPVPAGRVHHVTWHIRTIKQSVAPGVTQTRWAFDGRVPGPALHGHVGDTFVIHVVNDTNMIHSIDFHAEQGAPAKIMRPIAPDGGSITYRFTATHAGAFLYHCGTAPILEHLGNGMYGAIIIDPPGLRPVAASYILVASELFFGPEGKAGDYPKMQRDDADAVVFNGYPFAYKHAPIHVPSGRSVRIWVVDAGPNRSISFHVVGGQFSAVYLDGGYLVHPGSAGAGEVLPLTPGDGGFVDITFHGSGNYPFLTHHLADAELGATGLFAAS